MKEEILDFARVIGEPTRIRIMNHLKRECCAGDIWEKLGLPQNLVSHHLRILRESKLVTAKKDGKHIVYRLNNTALRRHLKKLNDCLLGG